MEFTEENKAVIRDEVNKFITDEDFTQEKACKERRTNMKEAVCSLNKKFWAVILLLIANLVGLVITGFGG